MGNLQNLMDYCQNFNIDLFEDCTVPAPLDLQQVKNNIMLRCGLLTPVYSEPEVFKMMTKMWFDSNQWNFEHLIKIILAEYSPIENVVDNDWWKEEHTGTDKRTMGGDDKLFHGETHTLSGQDTLGHGETHTLSGQDTLGHGETHTLSGTDTLTHGEKHTLSGTDTLTHGETHTLSGSDSVSDTTSNEHTVSAYNAGTYQADSKDTKSGGPSTTYGKVDTASGQDSTGYGKTDTASGDDKTQYGKKDTASGTDTTTYGKTDTASGTDTTTYGKTDTASGVDTTEYGKTDDLEHGENIEYHRYRHSNVGVTSNQQLIEQELALLEHFNIYDWIAAKFERDNMIQLY